MVVLTRFSRMDKKGDAEERFVKKHGKKRFLVYSEEMKKLIKTNKGVLLAVFGEITRNLVALQHGTRLEMNGIIIEKATPIGWKGIERKTTLKVTAASREFFVKVSDAQTAVDVFRTIEKANSLLKKRRNNVSGFNVRVIQPLLVYQKGSHYFFATKFYNLGQVFPVLRLDEERKKAVSNALKEIASEFEAQGIFGPVLYNSFYEPKTNTILLFDLHSEPQKLKLL